MRTQASFTHKHYTPTLCQKLGCEALLESQGFSEYLLTAKRVDKNSQNPEVQRQRTLRKDGGFGNRHVMALWWPSVSLFIRCVWPQADTQEPSKPDFSAVSRL